MYLESGDVGVDALSEALWEVGQVRDSMETKEGTAMSCSGLLVSVWGCSRLFGAVWGLLWLFG